MKNSMRAAGFLVVAFAVVFAFAGCSKKSNKSNGSMTDTTSTMMQNNMGNGQMMVSAKNSDFVANLSGKNEVPSVQTDASGMAYFKVSNDSSKIMYTIKLSNADSVTMAHIHYGVAGENGPPVVWLYPAPDNHTPSATGTVNGVLKSGTFTSSNLVGPLKGGTIKDLIMAIKHDSIYVNVHNKAHPAGFIRGQIHSSGMMMGMDSDSTSM